MRKFSRFGCNIDAIFAEGLKPMSRRHVHLSADIETAAIVGRRRGAPIVLLVDAAAMNRDGVDFFRADNGVWLTTEVAPPYLKILTED
ncbi:MAG: RNA 2'-phosphotransferase [Pseudomonadota bacterium]